MKIEQNLPLAPLTTLRVGGPAKFYVSVNNGAEAAEAFALAKKEGLPLFIFAGGSNMVIADRGLEAVVLHPNMRGITITHEDADTATLRAASGEVWDEVVAFAVARGLWGIENLSAIPGYTGAAPIQNIGAYGQEVKDTLTNVEALDMQTGALVTFANQDCAFGYRHSRFNTTDKGRYLILAVSFTLSKQGQPNLNYKDLQLHFAGKPTPGVAEMREAVTFIRTNKLHNPAEQGNVGSFFKNKVPFISEAEFDAVTTRLNPILSSKLQERLATFRTAFRTAEGIKIPGGFLIEACGLMGHTHGGMAVSDKHALVLINKNGTATAADALHLAAHVLKTVRTQTGLELVPEPMFVGFSPEELEQLYA
jgi:UDP-N-acetylmuramate dehydrogenase